MSSRAKRHVGAEGKDGLLFSEGKCHETLPGWVASLRHGWRCALIRETAVSIIDSGKLLRPLDQRLGRGADVKPDRELQWAGKIAFHLAIVSPWQPKGRWQPGNL